MDRDSLVYSAKLAEQAERFDEMVGNMKEVAKQPQELTVEERNLLSVAYKNVIGSRRASWRVVTSIEQKGADKMEIIKDYKSKIETELVDICNDILGIIDDSLIPNSTSEEAKVFYYKMKGDYVSPYLFFVYTDHCRTTRSLQNFPSSSYSTATFPSSKQETPERKLLEPPLMLTRPPVELLRLTFHRHTPSVLVLP
jgi:hypothetical protein